MNNFYVISIILVFAGLITAGIGFFASKNKKDCLSGENFNLINENELADKLSKYKITRSKNELLFSTHDNYKLFILKKSGNDKIELLGLDGYGLRDKEFHKFICQLIDSINSKSQT